MTELDYFSSDELAASTWRNKYARKEDKTPDDMHIRMANEFARIEKKFEYKGDKSNLSDYGKLRKVLSDASIYSLFKDFKYIIPGGSVMSGLGSDSLVSLSNCFVIDSPQDSYSDLMQKRNFQVQLMKRRGGVGYDLSKLRPRGARVNNAAKTSTGAASFMEVCSEITREVAQNGRRGALMLTMNINHPDIEEFISIKQDLTKVTGANISVKVTDEFMQAVEKDDIYFLRYPIGSDLRLDPNSKDLDDFDVLHQDLDGIYYKKIKAKKLWDTLMHCAWNTAEPGIIFESRMHNYSPDGVYPDFKMISTNPCSEIGMGAFDSCRLIHINLSSYIKKPFTADAEINDELLYAHSYEAMRLGDDLVELEVEAVDRIIEAVKDNKDFTEFNLWSRIKKTALEGRRVGLGFTGLADAIAMLGLKYDSDEAIRQVKRMMNIMFKGQLNSTVDMAIERGVFPASNIEEELYGNDWYEFVKGFDNDAFRRMMTYGRRNISWSTVAPTGTVSLLTRTSSGIEPVFMPFYQRKRKCINASDRVDYTDAKGDKYTLFTVVHPNLKKWVLINQLKDAKSPIIKHMLPESVIEGNLEWYIDNMWTLKEWETAFRYSPYYQSTAPEIDWHQRVKLQGVIQKYITHSISSTVNLSNDTKEEEIADIYIEAWKHGLKGITIYRDGCREGVLSSISKSKSIDNRQAPKRPKELEADYYQVKVKKEQFIVLVGLLGGKPYEVFAFRPLHSVNIDSHKGIITKVSKMHYNYKSEFINITNIELANSNIEEKAATLYSSMLLRHGVDIKYIIKTAKKVNDNISSFSSAMCRVLAKYIPKGEDAGELCPECGNKLTRESGCLICKNCGYSRCN